MGVIVTDTTVPAQYIDRIYILQDDGTWATIGLVEVLACRITGNGDGKAGYTRSPAQAEIEDDAEKQDARRAVGCTVDAASKRLIHMRLLREVQYLREAGDNAKAWRQ